MTRLSIRKAIPFQWCSRIKRLIRRKAILIHLKKFKRKHGRIVIFIATPTHGNLGDHAIVYAQHQFMEQIGVGDRVFELTRQQYELCREQLKTVITPDDVLIIDGGGNIGTLWIEEENKMRDIILRFPENPIFVFPQTAYYSNDIFGRAELEKSAKIYCSHRKLTIFARDSDTDRLLKREFRSIPTFFVPDIVLFITDALKNATCRAGVLLCMRGDTEKITAEESLGNIEKYLIQCHYGYRKISTVVDHTVTARMRERELFRKWAEFSSARLVITDRLHGMLFAAITGTPCLALDNVSHKVKQGYEWIEYLPYIKFCENPDELICNITEFYEMGEQLYRAEPLLAYFSQMQSKVKRTVDNAEQTNNL